MKGLFLLSMTEYELAIDVLSPYQDEEKMLKLSNQLWSSVILVCINMIKLWNCVSS